MKPTKLLNSELFLTTAGGCIKCLRCTAMSKRTRLQCGKPALKTSKTQKCQFHGGRSTGPKTEAGKARISAAQLTPGRETQQIRAERSKAALVLAQLEDAMHVLNMTTAPRTRGRKPKGYRPLNTLNEVREVVAGCALHKDRGPAEGYKFYFRNTQWTAPYVCSALSMCCRCCRCCRNLYKTPNYS